MGWGGGGGGGAPPRAHCAGDSDLSAPAALKGSLARPAECRGRCPGGRVARAAGAKGPRNARAAACRQAVS